jgi:hypothetical protein
MLTLGQPPAAAEGRRLERERLGSLFRLDPGTIGCWACDLTALKAALDHWRGVWNKWKPTAVGKKLEELDLEDLLGTLEGMQRQLSSVPSRWSGRVWAEADCIQFADRGEDFAPAPALAETAIAQFVPADAEAFRLDSLSNLGDWLVSALWEAEGGLDAQTLRGGARGERAQAIIEAYYGHFQATRDVIVGQAPQVFRPPVAFLVGTRGRLKKFELSFTSGEQQRALRRVDQTVTELAAIGKTTGADQAAKLVDSFYRSLIQDAFTASGMQPDEKVAAIKPLDLQLGVSTYGFDAGWIARLPGAAKVQIGVEGDLLPHWFLVGDVFVFSTSTRLSRAILAAQSGRSPRLVLPALPDQGKLVVFGLLPGRVLQKVFEDLGEWIRPTLEDGRLATRGEPAPLVKLTQAIAGISELIGLIGEVHWQVYDRKDVRTTDGSITFQVK